MKRTILFLTAILFSLISFSQKDETLSSVLASKEKTKQQEAMEMRNLKDDKTEFFDITGFNGGNFSIMNFPDGSSRGNNQSSKITFPFIVSKGGNCQLVFNPDTEKTTYVVEQKNGMTSVFYPMATYNALINKLEQLFNAKKKVQLKITQNPNGYRQADFIF
ncbi:MAG: hypothetical protein WBC06_04680 [Chitinophagaceae bacterium]